MEKRLFDSVYATVKNWWISLIIGILSLALGVVFLFKPAGALAALVILFVVSFFIAGLFDIFFAVSNRKIIRGWGWTLAAGIIDILLGVFLLFIPAATPWVMIYFVGFWILFQSIWAIGISVDFQRSGVDGWGWMLALAILGIILSFAFILSPVFASGFIVAIAAVAFIVYGIFRIYLSIKYRSLKKDLDD